MPNLSKSPSATQAISRAFPPPKSRFIPHRLLYIFIDGNNPSSSLGIPVAFASANTLKSGSCLQTAQVSLTHHGRNWNSSTIQINWLCAPGKSFRTPEKPPKATPNRRNSPLLSIPISLERRFPTLADVIPVPSRNLHRHIALYYCLTPQPRPQRQPCRHLQPVQLIVFSFGKMLLALCNNHVASCACTAASAGMVEVKIVVHRNIKQRLRLSMVVVWKLAGFEFKGLVLR